MRRFAIHEALLCAGAVAWATAAAFWTTGSGPILITPLLAALLVLTVVAVRRGIVASRPRESATL